MADAGWLRFFGANRARQHGLKSHASEAALHDILKDTSGNKEAHNQHKRDKMSRLPSWQGVSQTDRGAASFTGADSALDQADKAFINASQEVWHSPSVDQLAESLRSALMTSEGNVPLPAEYRPHVLLLCEFYGTRHNKIAKLESQLAEAKDELEKETKRHKSIEEHWMVQDARYKAEVKRLEMFIHQTSDKGMEAVVLARAGSLIRNKPRVTAQGRTSVETNLTTTTSDTSPKNAYAEAAPNSALPTRQGTVLSRTRTTDTSNEVRLSNVFRKLEKTKNTTNGARRTDVGHGKARLELRRASQHSQSRSMPHTGPSTRDTVGEPPHEGSPERKRDSTEKTAALQEVGVVSQPIYTATASRHEREKAKQDKVSENKSSQSTGQGYTRHLRQFSFVPGDDITAVKLGDAKAPGGPPVSQNENSQVPSTGQQTVRLRQECQRSRSTEWI